MTVLALLIAVLALVFVAWPLLSPAGDAAVENIEEDPRDRLEERRSSLYESIRDLDFEYSMGKLTESDHRLVRDDLMMDAAKVLEAIDAAPSDPAVDRWIESRVNATARAPEGSFCRSCGASNPGSARFCNACGVAQ